MVILFTRTIIQTGFTRFFLKFVFKVVQIYLKKDMSQTVCISFFYFVTGDCEKLICGAVGVKK